VSEFMDSEEGFQGGILYFCGGQSFPRVCVVLPIRPMGTPKGSSGSASFAEAVAWSSDK